MVADTEVSAVRFLNCVMLDVLAVEFSIVASSWDVERVK